MKGGKSALRCQERWEKAIGLPLLDQPGLLKRLHHPVLELPLIKPLAGFRPQSNRYLSCQIGQIRNSIPGLEKLISVRRKGDLYGLWCWGWGRSRYRRCARLISENLRCTQVGFPSRGRWHSTGSGCRRRCLGNSLWHHQETGFQVNLVLRNVSSNPHFLCLYLVLPIRTDLRNSTAEIAKNLLLEADLSARR